MAFFDDDFIGTTTSPLGTSQHPSPLGAFAPPSRSVRLIVFASSATSHARATSVAMPAETPSFVGAPFQPAPETPPRESRDDDVGTVEAFRDGGDAPANAPAPVGYPAVSGDGEPANAELDEVDRLMESLRALAEEAERILPEGEWTRNRLLAAKFRLRRAKASAEAERRESAEGADCHGGADCERDADVDEDAQPAEETALRRERARAEALLRSTTDGLDFWRGLADDASHATLLLNALLRVALEGNADIALDGARDLANRHVERLTARHAATPSEMHAACESMIAWQSAASFGAGFAAGLGGLVTLPVTVPATLAVNMTTSLRLAFAVAIVGGHDPMRPRTAAAAISAALGMSDDEIADETRRPETASETASSAARNAIFIARENGPSEEEVTEASEVTAASARREVDRNVADAAARAAIRSNGAVLQGGAWKIARIAAARLVARGAARGSGAIVARALPIVGGIVGGGFDASHAAAAGKRATRRFLPPKPKSPSPAKRAAASSSSPWRPTRASRHASFSPSIVDEPARWSAGMDRLGEDAREGFERVGASFESFFRGASAAAAETMDRWSTALGTNTIQTPSPSPRARPAGIGDSPVGYQASGGFEGDVDVADVLFDVFADGEDQWEREATRRAAEEASASAAEEEALERAKRALDLNGNGAHDGKEGAYDGKKGADGKGAQGAHGAPSSKKSKRAATRAARWAAHESKWAALLADAASAEPIAYEDVPWPPTTRGAVSSCAGRGADAAKRRTYRRFVLRWHPDKFAARFGARLVDADKERVMERVHDVSRAVVEEWAELETRKREASEE